MEGLLNQFKDLSLEDRTRALASMGITEGRGDGGGSGIAGGSHPPTGGNQAIQSSTFHRKLRLFSGRVPVPHGEVEYVGWRMKVRQIQTDNDDRLTDGQLKRLILESLQRPTLDALRNSTGSSTEILEVLDTL